MALWNNPRWFDHKKRQEQLDDHIRATGRARFGIREFRDAEFLDRLGSLPAEGYYVKSHAYQSTGHRLERFQALVEGQRQARSLNGHVDIGGIRVVAANGQVTRYRSQY